MLTSGSKFKQVYCTIIPLATAGAPLRGLRHTNLPSRSPDTCFPVLTNLEINLYAGVAHGFAVRGELSDKRQKYAKEAAFLQAVQWFDYHLKGEDLAVA
jgi:hypothetical protein